MPEGLGRRLEINQHVIAEQGLLNLALQGQITILKDGRDVTLALISQGKRINAQFDLLVNLLARGKSLTEHQMEMVDEAVKEVLKTEDHPKPSGMPKKKTEPAVPRVKRTRTRAVNAATADEQLRMLGSDL